MTARQVIVPGAMPSRDRNGRALPGKLRFYEVDTTTPATVYTSNALTTAHSFPILSDSSGRWPAIWAHSTDSFDVAWSDQTFDALVASYSGVSPADDAVLASVALAEAAQDAAEDARDIAVANGSTDNAAASAASATAAAASASAASTSASAASTSATAASGSATSAAGSATAAAASAAAAAGIVGFDASAIAITGAGLATGGGNLTASRAITVTKSSQAQAQAGTDDATAMTPARVSDAIAALAIAYLAPVVTIQDQKTSGSAAQALTFGTWVQRNLNTAVRNVGSLATVSSNALSLSAGTYAARARASVRAANTAGMARARLYNATDSAVIAEGMQVPIIYDAADSVAGGGAPEVDCVFTLAGTKTLQLQTYHTGNDGDGGAAMTTGSPEIYAHIDIWKVG